MPVVCVPQVIINKVMRVPGVTAVAVGICRTRLDNKQRSDCTFGQRRSRALQTSKEHDKIVGTKYFIPLTNPSHSD